MRPTAHTPYTATRFRPTARRVVSSAPSPPRSSPFWGEATGHFCGKMDRLGQCIEGCFQEIEGLSQEMDGLFQAEDMLFQPPGFHHQAPGYLFQAVRRLLPATHLLFSSLHPILLPVELLFPAFRSALHSAFRLSLHSAASRFLRSIGCFCREKCVNSQPHAAAPRLGVSCGRIE